MLMTELQLSRRRGLVFPQPERMKKVRKSMGAIRQVLGERKRKRIDASKERELSRRLTDEIEDWQEEETFRSSNENQANSNQ